MGGQKGWVEVIRIQQQTITKAEKKEKETKKIYLCQIINGVKRKYN